ncbi:MAG: replication protein [Desulfovibrio sp.]|nr:replication protein [Desulfovibrio sp.]
MFNYRRRKPSVNQKKEFDPNLMGKGYVRIPDLVMHLFMTKAISDPSKRVYMAILNETIRFNHLKRAVRNRDIVFLTGIDSRNVKKYLDELSSKRFIRLHDDEIEVVLDVRSWVLDEFTRELIGSRLGEGKQAVVTTPVEEVDDQPEDDLTEEELMERIASM